MRQLLLRIISFFKGIKPSLSRKKQSQPISSKPTPQLSRLADSVFQLSHGKTRKEWLRFLVFLLVFFYFLGLTVIMTLAYQPQTFRNPDEDYTKISRMDRFMEAAVTIYPLPAAVVNDEVISLKDFYTQLSYIKHFNARVPNSLPPEVTNIASLRRQVLENLIETRIIRQEARKYKITVSTSDVDAAYKTATEQNGGPEQVEKVLHELYDMTPEEFKQLIRDQILKEKIMKTLLVQVHVRHIISTDQKKSTDLIARLNKGEAFEAVATAESEDASTKGQGGDLGWLGRQDMKDKIDPEFEKAAMALSKGQITAAPVKTKFGYHIIKLEDKRGRVDKPYGTWFEEIKDKAKIMRFIRS